MYKTYNIQPETRLESMKISSYQCFNTIVLLYIEPGIEERTVFYPRLNHLGIQDTVANEGDSSCTL